MDIDSPETLASAGHFSCIGLFTFRNTQVRLDHLYTDNALKQFKNEITLEIGNVDKSSAVMFRIFTKPYNYAHIDSYISDKLASRDLITDILLIN